MKVIVYFQVAGEKELEMSQEDFMQLFVTGLWKINPADKAPEKVEKIALYSDKPNKPNKIIHFS